MSSTAYRTFRSGTPVRESAFNTFLPSFFTRYLVTDKLGIFKTSKDLKPSTPTTLPRS
jgi:hypothetical protein